MDSTPYDFRERVAALWKCCDDGEHNVQCVDSTVPDCEWTRKAEKKRITFYIGCENGTWKYSFFEHAATGVIMYAFIDSEALDKLLTLEQMLANPNLKNVTIETIFVYDQETTDDLQDLYEKSPLVDVNMERLMKVVTFLSNDVALCLNLYNAQDFNTREGKCLLKCLSYMKFSSIKMWNSFPVYNQLLGNQFSRRIPTEFVLEYVDENRKFFQKNLENGKIKRFYELEDSIDRFPAEVMEGIINSFLKNPEEYKEGYFDISAQFDESTEALLERNREEGSCYKHAYSGYSFISYNSKLQMDQILSIKISGKSSYECTLSAF